MEYDLGTRGGDYGTGSEKRERRFHLHYVFLPDGLHPLVIQVLVPTAEPHWLPEFLFIPTRSQDAHLDNLLPPNPLPSHSSIPFGYSCFPQFLLTLLRAPDLSSPRQTYLSFIAVHTLSFDY